MKRFFVVTNKLKDLDRKITANVKACIEFFGGICYLCKDEEHVAEELKGLQVEGVLVIGGDGTLIRTSRQIFGMNIPLLGINMGTLGYLTDVEVHNVEGAIEQLVKGNYSVENRMMLYGSTISKKSGEKITDVALNDIVVTRSVSVKMLVLNLYVNGEFLNTYKADGIIVSTPTGSTAYNLSAGGPIVEPTASLMLVTPICSHALNSSSIVLSDRDEIEIEIGQRREGLDDEVTIAVDGEDAMTLKSGDMIRIKKAHQTAQIIKLSKISFLETLREKMKGN